MLIISLIIISTLAVLFAVLFGIYFSKYNHCQKERFTHPDMKSRPLINPTLTNFIKGMPKTALHMHIEGSLEAPMAFNLAKKYKMLPLKVPKDSGGYTSVNTLADLKKVYQFNDLKSFLNIYNLLATTLKKKEDFTALAWAYCERVMGENVQHAEIFFDPQTHLARGLSFADVVDGIQEGLEKGRRRGLSVQLICSFLRDHPVGQATASAPSFTSKNPNSDPTAWDVIKQCVEYNKTALMPGGAPGERPPSYFIVGMGLDNNEVGFPPKLFTEVYRYGMANGLFSVAHGGEEGPPEYIWQCIKDLKCIRIDHGVRAPEDPQLVTFMSTPSTRPELTKFYGHPHKTPVTVCPLSNYKLDVFPDPTRTSIIEMLDLGLMATVNSDDPAYFGGYVTENYLMLLKDLNPHVAKGRPIDLADVKRLCLNGFMASVLPMNKKLEYLEGVNNYFLTTPGLLYKKFVSKYQNK